MDVRSRARVLSLAVLAVVFGSGIVVGFAWDRHLDAAEAEASRAAESRSADATTDLRRGSEGPQDADSTRTRRGRAMYDQVDPTEAQRVRIDSIVDAYRQEVRTFHRESRREYDEGMRAIVLQTREAIKSVLDPAQREKYDSLTAARDSRVRDDEESGRERN